MPILNQILQRDDYDVCRCPCHDPEFASVAKHKNGVVCCDGKCEHCGSFIVSNLMEKHTAECHPEIDAIKVPAWLRNGGQMNLF